MLWALHSSGDHFVKLILHCDGERARACPVAGACRRAAPGYAGNDDARAGQAGGQEEARGEERGVKKSSTAKPKSSAAHGGHERTPASGSMTQPTMDHAIGACQCRRASMPGTMAMTGALGPYPMEREFVRHRVAARRVRAHGADE